MQRRKFILGMGATAAGGSALLGSGAFTSVQADRDIAIDVVGDADAFLRLAPCTDEEGNPKPNGGYVHGHTDGTMTIDLSEENDNVLGDGVNNDALSTFHNVFEICNQGTQPVCVNFAVDVPEIPGPVPGGYDFEAGDPAVVFYENSDEDAVISASENDPSLGRLLETGECICVGFNVRAFGFDTGDDIFEDAELEIVADADAECGNGIQPPEEEPEVLCGQWASSVEDNDIGFAIESDGSIGSVADERTNPAVATGPVDEHLYPTANNYNIDDDDVDDAIIFHALGFSEAPDDRDPGTDAFVELAFDGPITRNPNPDAPDIVVYEATNGNRFDYGIEGPEAAEVYVTQGETVHSVGMVTSRGSDGDTNTGINELTIPEDLEGPFDSVLIEDRTQPDDFGIDEGYKNFKHDAFDLDGVRACILSEPEGELSQPE